MPAKLLKLLREGGLSVRQGGVGMTADVLHREIGFRRRGLDEKARTADFVAATETPVSTYYGVEVLRVNRQAVDLERYQKNPIVVDSHNYYSSSGIVGSAESVRIVGKELLVQVRFATTPRGEEAWQLVKEGHLRAVSVGYQIDPKRLVQLAIGEQDGDVTGPATIVEGWRLLEVSVCALPADPNALMRSRSAVYQRLGLKPQGGRGLDGLSDGELLSGLCGAPVRASEPDGWPVGQRSVARPGKPRSVDDLSDSEVASWLCGAPVQLRGKPRPESHQRPGPKGLEAPAGEVNDRQLIRALSGL